MASHQYESFHVSLNDFLYKCLVKMWTNEWLLANVILSCFFILLDSINVLLQCEQWNGFWPVWSISCCLKVHDRTHTTEMPFSCSYCDKTFAHSSTFKQHEITHTGQKPFHCSHCNKTFIESISMKKHERITLARSHSFGHILTRHLYKQVI